MSKTLLITGATGKQGGSFIDALLAQEADFEILALTRDANSGGAQKLVKKSPKIKIVEGTLDEPDVIFRNAKNVTTQPIWGVFSVQTVSGAKHEIEEKQGKDLVDASLKNNVQLFVYTSVDRGGDASFDNPTPIPHFITKHNIEHHLVQKTANAENAMSWTILRPTAFFDNFTPDFFGKVFATCWKVAVKEKPLQLISVRDIGHFGAQSFLNPDEYKRKCVSLAGDDLTFDEMAEQFKEKTGNDVPLTFEFLARIMLWFAKDLGLMFKWFYEGGYGVDIPKLRRIDPELKDFRGWLETESGFDVKGE